MLWAGGEESVCGVVVVMPGAEKSNGGEDKGWERCKL